VDRSSSANQEQEHTVASSAFFYDSEPSDELETSFHRRRNGSPRATYGASRSMIAAPPWATGTSPFGPAPDEKGDELPTNDWRLLEEGVCVLVERDNGPVLGGEVDEITSDASVVWIWLDGGRGRIALFKDEGTRVWLPKGYELRAFGEAQDAPQAGK
jgi:hypothetical protein